MQVCDVLVIGGGIAGIGVAAMLAPEARVVVLEAESTPGYHATGRSAALFIRNYGGPVLRALNAASEGFLLDPGAIAEGSLLSPRGELLLAAEDETEALATYMQGAEGMERITPAEAVELVPILRPERIAAACLEGAARDIDVDRLFQGLMRRLRGAGGAIVTGARATGIGRAEGLWQVRTAAGDWAAPVLVNAAGGWADQVAGLAGVAGLGLRPLRRSAALLPAPEGFDIRRWPLFATVTERWYAKPEAGMLMVSPAEEDPVEPHDVWPDDMVLAEGLDRYQQAVRVPVTRVTKSWAGMRTFAPDRVPVAGFATDAQGFFWLAGQGGYGIQTAPALSRLAADLIAGRAPALPAGIVAALSPARLAPG